MDQITATLATVDAHLDALARAYRELAGAAEAAGHEYEPICKKATEEAERLATTKHIRRFLAEIRRPKGAIVDLRWTGGGKEPRRVEVVRRTATRVLVDANLQHGKQGTWYHLDDGRPVERAHDRWLGQWRITDEGLETIRAMPVGENAVSRALKAGT